MGDIGTPVRHYEVLPDERPALTIPQPEPMPVPQPEPLPEPFPDPPGDR